MALNNKQLNRRRPRAHFRALTNDNRSDNRPLNGRQTRDNRRPVNNNRDNRSCTWCHSRGFNSANHVWQERLKLQNATHDQLQGSRTQPTPRRPHAPNQPPKQPPYAQQSTYGSQTGPYTDMADAYVGHSVPYEWKFDTGSSAHMTNQIEQFECLTPSHRLMRVGGNSLSVLRDRHNCT